MSQAFTPLFSLAFLRSALHKEYDAFKGSKLEAELDASLKAWNEREFLKETSAESTFMEEFFRNLWGYKGTGQVSTDSTYHLYPKYSIAGSGQTGGKGEADLVIGMFRKDEANRCPQIVCEFKDITSNLDAPQKRKGNNRSPVAQCKDYLWGARKGLFGNESTLPTWGIVTDMNEFRLYWYDRMPDQYMRFIIKRRTLLDDNGLLDGNDEDTRFQKFLFYRLFQAKSLLAETGKCELLKLLTRQWVREREIEDTYYSEYRKLRDRLFKTLVDVNPQFQGTKGKLVRLSQRILDRCLFIFYCEDMGEALAFPPQMFSDFLREKSKDEFFDPNADDIWAKIKSLFKSMDKGGTFPPHKIGKFNGGLFAHDPEMDSLNIPNYIFCEAKQGDNEASLNSYKNNILYLCASYNYADKGDANKSLGLYTLGRIFEQSITELEIMEAEAEGLESVNKLSKRKRDGVYYTPEHVVQKLVEETIGPRLKEIKAECGWKEGKELKAGNKDDQAVVQKYWDELQKLTVVDPACGSGAFLITALQFLLREYRATQALLHMVNKKVAMKNDGQLIEQILSKNLYGVDINPASVEITKLALWLHTARAGEPLSALDENIRDGNSLIDKTFYLQKGLLKYDDDEKERVNAFTWWDIFPKVHARGGFDIVLGNPPYVKLQNFRKAHPDMAEYLKEGRLGKSYYESTQYGNFDLYLPFIEKGISLLNDKGRMGYIAPSVWLMNEYGEGLKRYLLKTKQLDRWVDFKSYQVFSEATVYTALQFFTKHENDAVRLVDAPTGDISHLDWEDKDYQTAYKQLKADEAWILLPKHERDFINRLNKICHRLDDKSVTKNIFVGIQTSADHIYHLKKLGKDCYECSLPKKPAYQVEIEDAVMKPLVSGPEAKRYLEPITDTYLLFPYETKGGNVSLINESSFKKSYPKAWKYLLSWETQLRAREDNKMDDDKLWWSYNYPKNLDKQDKPKILMPRLVVNPNAFYDSEGKYYLDNVDVGGIEVASGVDAYYLTACLNSKVCAFVFRRISKPFRGDYRSANKQFIAPLPIPKADKNTQAQIGKLAKQIQDKASLRRGDLQRMMKRWENIGAKKQPIEWLVKGLGTVDDWIDKAPEKLDSHAKEKWAKKEREAALQAFYDGMADKLVAEANLVVDCDHGELRLSANGKVIIDGVFIDKAHEKALVAQWAFIASTFTITDSTTPKKLCEAFLNVALKPLEQPFKQFLELQADVAQLETEIAQAEAQIEAVLVKLYKLSTEEMELIRKG